MPESSQKPDDDEREPSSIAAYAPPPTEVQRLENVIGKKLNPEQVIQLHDVFSESFSGPLPHPDHFERYAQVVKGGGDRILTMAENEQKHRHLMDASNANAQDRVIDADIIRANRGQWMAFSILISLILGGVVLFAFDKPMGAWASFIGAILTGVYNIFRPRFNDWSPWQAKRETLNDAEQATQKD